jgi:CHAT domain-containing protein
MFHRAAPHSGTFLRCVTRGFVSAALCVFVCAAVANSALIPPLQVVSPAAHSLPETGQEPPVQVEAGKVIDREIAGNQSHAYQIAVPEGQCASLVVDQRGIDLAIEVLDPAGKVLVVYDSEKRRTGEEKFDILGGGTVRFNVRSVYYGAEPARYQLQLAETRPAAEADRNSYQARLVGTQGDNANRAGNYDVALKLEAQALDLAQRSLSDDDPLVATITLHLALVTRTKGDYDKAGSLFRSAVDAFRKSRGDSDPLTALAIGDEGLISNSKAEWVAAAAAFQKAIELTEQSLPPDDPQVGEFLMNRSVTYSGRGDYTHAMADLQQALVIFRKYLEPGSLSLTKALYDIGDVYLDTKDLDQSKKYSLEALATLEKKFGPDHPYCAYPLQNLGIVARRQKDYDLSLQYLWRSEKIREKALGRRHPVTAQLLVNIANVDHDKGDYNEEVKLLLEALDIMEATGGPYNPSTLKTLANLERSYSAMNDPAHAYEYQARLDAMAEKSISLNLAAGSEREKLTYVEMLTNYNQRSIWMSVAEAPNDQRAADGAATAILQRKARVLDALAESVATLRSHLKPEDQALLDQLASTTADLAKLSLAGLRKTPIGDYQAQLHALELQREKLEADISLRSNGYFESEDAVTLAAVEQAIPEDAALVEYSTYKPFYPRIVGDEIQYGAPRYVAFVIFRQSKVRWVDLGPVSDINAAIAKWRGALADPHRNDTSALARALDAKMMAPIRALAADASRLLISPEGDLNLIPFEALVDEHQKFLVERYSVTYLTTGRDLLRMQNARASRSAPLVVANPLFGEASRTLVAQAEDAQKSESARRSVTTGSSLADVYFAPLPGTEQEARAIQSSFPNARVVSGSAATKAALQHTPAPEILHIATHGFFLQDPSGDLARNAKDDPATRGAEAGPQATALSSQNPLLRAGLALSGANTTKDGSENGILTGLEAAGLDLWGTKLVTLSACETGIGTVKDGEGVYGLRRAFFLAGTETLVMSLWEVSDRVTREMMTSYYAGLKSGLGRGEALRQAQLEMLKRKDRQHPFYWASFIQAGEWASLDGKR